MARRRDRRDCCRPAGTATRHRRLLWISAGCRDRERSIPDCAGSCRTRAAGRRGAHAAVSLPVCSAMSRTLCHAGTYPQLWPARVQIRARRQRYVRVMLHPHGDARQPLTWAELAANCSGHRGSPIAGPSADRFRFLNEWRDADGDAPTPAVSMTMANRKLQEAVQARAQPGWSSQMSHCSAQHSPRGAISRALHVAPTAFEQRGRRLGQRRRRAARAAGVGTARTAGHGGLHGADDFGACVDPRHRLEMTRTGSGSPAAAKCRIRRWHEALRGNRPTTSSQELFRAERPRSSRSCAKRRPPPTPGSRRSGTHPALASASSKSSPRSYARRRRGRQLHFALHGSTQPATAAPDRSPGCAW